MRIACMLGFHSWVGCKCTLCGRARNKDHDWSADCQRCARCGLSRQIAHPWDGGRCSVCGKGRPLRPPRFERPSTYEAPSKRDIEEAKLVARLVGYLNVFYGSDESVQGAAVLKGIEIIGEVITYQVGGLDEEEFVSIARIGVAEAGGRSISEIKGFCAQHIPMILKYKYLFSSDKFSSRALNALEEIAHPGA